MTSKIKVLVVDDSAFMRKMISTMLDTRGIRVVATARNGKDALKKLEEYKPDVVTLDVEMPVMSGLDFLRKVMKDNPLPVIMLSSLTEKNSVTTIKALELGAVDFIPKPSGTISLDIDKVEAELIKKVRVAAKSSPSLSKSSLKDNKKFSRKSTSSSKNKRINQNKFKSKSKPISKAESKSTRGKKLVVIGASTGGPRALKEVMTRINENTNCGILIVQHMPPNFTASLAHRLDKLAPIKVKEAEDGDQIMPGRALLAPGDYHMLINSDGTKVKLNQDDKVHNVRPAIDLTMESAARYYGSRTLGVILTGMGKDGTRGLEAIKSVGGYTIAQDEETSVVYGMPKAAYRAGVVDSVKPLNFIGNEIMQYIKKLK